LAIPGFEIEAEVGRGGMGIVYRARQTSIGRTVAVKVLPPAVSKDPAFVEKFLTEAKAAARLNHENVVAAIDAGIAEDAASGRTVYFVMEFVDGETVRDLLDREGPLPLETALRILRDTARALVHAQKHGLVHRDVKPDNIMVSSDGRALLCDLGLARRAEESAGAAGKRTGIAEGTPYYIAPEQAKGYADIDIRADLYALGATAYHILTGEYAFDGEDARTIMVKQVSAPFPDILEKRADLPPALVALLERMVEKDRANRPAGPAEVVQELERLLSPRKASTEPEGPAAADEAPGGDAPSEGRRGPAPLVLAIGVAAALLIAVLGGKAILGGGDGAADPTGLVASSGSSSSTDPSGDATAAREAPPAGPSTVASAADPARSSSSASPSATSVAAQPGASGMDLSGQAAIRVSVLRENLRVGDVEPEEAERLWRELAEKFPGTPAAETAKAEADKLAAVRREPLEKKVRQAEKQATDLAKAGDFAGAVRALTKVLSEVKGGALEARVHTDIEKIEVASNVAVVMLEKAIAPLLAAGRTTEAAKACAEFAGRAVGASVERARTLEKECRAAGEKKAPAVVAADDTAEVVHARVKEGAYEEALTAIRAARAKPDGKARTPALDQLEREVEATRAAGQAYEAALSGLAGGERAELPLLVGGRAGGRIVAVEGVGAAAAGAAMTLWEGGKDSPATELRISELDPAWLRAKGLPPGKDFTHTGNGAYLVYAGALAAGVDELKAAERLGAALSEPLKRALDQASKGKDDALAEALHRRGAALQRIARDDEALTLLTRVAPRGDKAGTGYAKGHAAEIAEAWKAARAAQLLEGPMQAFFAGKVEGSGTRVRVRYDFDGAAELADWKPAKDGEGVDGSYVTRVAKGVEMRGRVAWKGAMKGEIAVEVGFLTGGGGDLNANVMVFDRGRPWEGWLCGVSTHIPGVDRFNIAKGAPKGAGALFDAPSHMIAGLRGDKDKAEVLFAARGPAVPTSGFRMSVTVKKRVLQVMLMGKPLAAVVIPEADMAGGIAIQPFDKKVLVEDVRVAGELDPGWLRTEALRMADVELTTGKRTP